MEDNSMTYDVRWADLDANRHMHYSAYIDAATELRLRFFNRHGLPMEVFDQMGVSPVYTTLTANFFREALLGETLTLTFLMAGLSPQGIRWKIRHDFLKANGKKSVTILLEGTFLDLVTRKATVLPAPILEVFQLVPCTPDFEVLSDRRWFRD